MGPKVWMHKARQNILVKHSTNSVQNHGPSKAVTKLEDQGFQSSDPFVSVSFNMSWHSDGKGRLARILDRWDDFTFYVLTTWWLGVQFKRQRKRMGLEPYFDTVQFDHVDGEDIFPEFSQSFQELPAIEWDKYIHERGPGIRGEWI